MIIKCYNNINQLMNCKKMKLTEFKAEKRTAKLTELSDKQLIKEIQSILCELDLLDIADGIVGANTIRAFRRFKEINYQSNPEYLGSGTAKLLLSAADKNVKPVLESGQEVIAPESGYTVGKINWLDFDCPISKYFTVREVINGDRRRVPISEQNIKKILLLVAELDKIRIELGQPILVNSWNRPPKINADVGGALYSQHIQGWGVDIRCHGSSIYEFQKWLDANWYGSLGYGAKKGFVHLDMRNGKGWKSAKNPFVKGVRWNY